jgi:hypothetical protein
MNRSTSQSLMANRCWRNTFTTAATSISDAEPSGARYRQGWLTDSSSMAPILADLDLGRELHHVALVNMAKCIGETTDELPVSISLCQMLGHGGVMLDDYWAKKTRGAAGKSNPEGKLHDEGARWSSSDPA